VISDLKEATKPILKAMGKICHGYIWATVDDETAYVWDPKGYSICELPDAITHETIHRVLRKYVGLEASQKLDNLNFKFKVKRGKNAIRGWQSIR
jgi:hypothetical protein